MMNGNILKLIALVTMLIDHIGAGILEVWLQYSAADYAQWERIRNLDLIVRGIGRIAFPIYCFLLVEGFLHTRNKWKYLGRMAVFAVISEVPFDLCFFGDVFYAQYQNVYLTLGIGLLMLIAIDYVKNLKGFEGVPLTTAKGLLLSLTYIAIVGAACVLAELLHTDYAAGGVLTIAMIYFMHATKKGVLLAEALSCTLVLNEIPALICLIPIWLYDGTRGKLNLKYLFYFFYPVHILLIWLTARLLGLWPT